jgi:hypothetical protein
VVAHALVHQVASVRCPRTPTLASSSNTARGARATPRGRSGWRRVGSRIGLTGVVAGWCAGDRKAEQQKEKKEQMKKERQQAVAKKKEEAHAAFQLLSEGAYDGGCTPPTSLVRIRRTGAVRAHVRRSGRQLFTPSSRRGVGRRGCMRLEGGCRSEAGCTLIRGASEDDLLGGCRVSCHLDT